MKPLVNRNEHQDSFWDFFWEQRLLSMENLGKRAAILTASRLLRQMAQKARYPLRLLELGCGEGQVIGSLLDAHEDICSLKDSVGVDYHPPSLAVCRRHQRGLRCIAGDLTDPALLASLGRFDLVLLVNTLHEVFSDRLVGGADEMCLDAARRSVAQALAGAAGCLEPEGRLVLFDGLEPPVDPLTPIRIRFRDDHARQGFELFARQYRPLDIRFSQAQDPLCVDLPYRDFTRYITKSIFLGKRLWQTEQLQSYQYFTEGEFRTAFERLDLEIIELASLTENEEKWRTLVEIVTPGCAFPQEHILIVAQPAKRG